MNTLVSKNCNRTAGITKPSELALGEIGIVANGLLYKAGSGGVKQFAVAVGMGDGNYVLSEPIEVEYVTSITAIKTLLPTTAKVIVGDNGLGNGLFTFENDKLYSLAVRGENSLIDNTDNTIVFSKVFKAGMKPVDFYTQLCESMKQTIMYPDKTLNYYMVSSTATVSTVNSLNLVFTKNSDYVTASSVTGLTVGDYLKVDGKLYKMEKIDTTKKYIKLAWYYKGDNKKVTNATVVTYTTLSTTDPTKVGLVIEGVSLQSDPRYGEYFRVVPRISSQDGFPVGSCREDFGCHPVGLHTQVLRDIYTSINGPYGLRNIDAIYDKQAKIVTTDDVYSVITIQQKAFHPGDATVAVQTKSINIYLNRGNYLALDTNEFGTSIVEATGLASGTADSIAFINALNDIFVKAKFFKEGLNTVNNGGGEIAADGILSVAIDV